MSRDVLSDDEWAEVRRKLYPAARQLCRRLPPGTPHTPDDLVQDGIAAAVLALREYDPRRNVPRVAFAVIRGRYAMLDAARDLNQVVRQPTRTIRRRGWAGLTMTLLNLDGLLWQCEPAGAGEPDGGECPRHEFRCGLRRAFGCLSPDEVKLLERRFFDGLTGGAIARRQRTTEAAVWCRLNVIMAELRGRGVDRATAAACLIEHTRRAEACK